MPTQDLVIYLQATPEVLRKRLKKKNAPGEKAVSDEYLEEVVKAYEQGSRRFDLGGTTGIMFNSSTKCRISSLS